MASLASAFDKISADAAAGSVLENRFREFKIWVKDPEKNYASLAQLVRAADC